VYPTQKKSDTTNVSVSHTEEIRYNKHLILIRLHEHISKSFHKPSFEIWLNRIGKIILLTF
jgi:hypothetical protein